MIKRDEAEEKVIKRDDARRKKNGGRHTTELARVLMNARCVSKIRERGFGEREMRRGREWKGRRRGKGRRGGLKGKR